MSRRTQDSAISRFAFAYGHFTLFVPAFQQVQLTFPSISCGPTTPLAWFGLLPFRSPLLGKSLLFSFPPATWMFRFAGFFSIAG